MAQADLRYLKNWQSYTFCLLQKYNNFWTVQLQTKRKALQTTTNDSKEDGASGFEISQKLAKLHFLFIAKI